MSPENFCRSVAFVATMAVFIICLATFPSKTAELSIGQLAMLLLIGLALVASALSSGAAR